MDRERLRSQLAAYLDGRHPGRPPGAPGPGPLLPLTGGWDSSLFTVALHLDGPGHSPSPMSVLKLYTPDADGREHAAREWRALSHLHGTNCPTPRVILLEPDPRHLGRPFVVMDHIPGTSFWHVHEAAPPEERARLTTSFVAPLVALHDREPSLLDPRAPLLDVRSCIDEELERTRVDSAGSARPALTSVGEWLERHVPRGLARSPPPGPRTVHGRPAGSRAVRAAPRGPGDLRSGLGHGHHVVAAAMIDRLVYHAEVLTVTGDSYRTRARRELTDQPRGQSSENHRRSVLQDPLTHPICGRCRASGPGCRGRRIFRRRGPTHRGRRSRNNGPTR